MPSYTLELELFSLLNGTTSDFEIWADGVQFGGGYSVSSSGTTISVSIPYGGSLPTSLEFRFDDAAPGSVDQIEIRAVKINDKYVNTGNYLSSNILNDGGSAAVDISGASFIFDDSEPAASVFTTGATRTLTAGNDTLRTFLSNDPERFDALAGHDRIYLGGGVDEVNGNDGDDIIYGGGGNDLLYGEDGNDRLYGDDGDDLIYGGNGDDRIQGDAGNDEIHGGAGNDRLNGQDGNDIITGGTGDDNLNGGAGDDYLFGGDDNDQLTGAAGNDTLDGGNGDDLVYGGLGNDIMNGGDGDDILAGFDGNDVISGDDGSDNLFGQDGDDTLHGGNGNDYVNGGNDNDIITGGAGNDVLVGGDGADTIDGGDGNDIIHGSGLTQQEIYNILQANPNAVYNANTNSFYQLVNGPTTWMAARTAALSSTINGVAGHLVNITSATENEFIYQMGLANGNDNSIGASGNRIWLGATDTITVDQQWFWQDGLEGGVQFSQASTPTNNMYENWGGGQPNNSGGAQVYATMWFNGGGNDDTWDDRNATDGHDYVIEWDAGLLSDDLSIDILNGGSGNDFIYGYGGNDILSGGDDDDVLFGGNGNDTLNGDNGDDALFGQDGDDTLNGGSNDDILAGGTGNDVLSGDGGNDSIYGVSFIDSAGSSANDGLTNSQNANFNTGLNGYAYIDDYFGASSGGGAFSNGTRDTGNGGLANGSLRIDLGGIDNSTRTNMSGAFQEVYTKASATTNVYLQVSYRIFHDQNFEAGETAFAFYDLNGTVVGIDSLNGNGNGGPDMDTGWITTTINFGVLAAGNHTLSLGGFLTQKTFNDESSIVWFDDVTWIEQEVSTNTGTTNTISGGDGLDTLYGSSETDIFVFESTSAFNDDDVIVNFNANEDDQIDISDLLTGFNPATDNISEFLQLTNSGSDTLIQVDTNGATGGFNYVTIGIIEDITGMDEVALYANGNIIA